MQGKPTGGKAQRATSDPLLGIDQPAPHSLPGTIAGGHLPLDRSSGDRGQQGLPLPQWIDRALFQQTPALQTSDLACLAGKYDAVNIKLDKTEGRLALAGRNGS